MQKLFFNQYEFPMGPSSEESLSLVIASKKECPDIEQFVKKCGVESLEQLLSNWEKAAMESASCPGIDVCRKWETVATAHNQFAESVRYFAKIDLQADGDTSNILILFQEWDHVEAIIESPKRYILCHWDTTA